jgi:hypothetical protein
MLGGVIAHLALDGARLAATATGSASQLEDLFEEPLMKPGALLRGEKSRR